MMDKFLLAFFGALDRLSDMMLGVDYCGCGHRAHCDKKCTECRCEHCNCINDKKKLKKKFDKQIAKMKARDPFIYK
jgi:hypothetical protein